MEQSKHQFYRAVVIRSLVAIVPRSGDVHSAQRFLGDFLEGAGNLGKYLSI
jgi:hypothetical protein